MLIRGFVRTIKNGSPVPDGTQVECRLHKDGQLVKTVTTTGGEFTLQLTGSPGPYYLRAALNDEVHISSSKVVGMSGPIDIGGLHLYFRLWSDGYIRGVLSQLAVTASGAGMQVTVAPGVALVRGVLYDQPTSQAYSIAAPASQPRIDTVCVEVIPPGAGEDVEGRTRIIVKQGAPAASPVAPSLTQTSTLWEHPLADVRVDAGVSSIASNKITDRRVPAGVILQDKQVTIANLADGPAPDASGQPVLVTDSRGRPIWRKLILNDLDDVTIGSAPADKSLLAYDKNTKQWVNRTADQLGLGSSTSGGTSSADGRYKMFGEQNFPAQGSVSGWATLGNAVQTLGAGKWLIESFTTFTAINTGSWGSFTVRLNGNGAPTGDWQSQRNFQTDDHYREIHLSGRKYISLTKSTSVSVAAQVTQESGSLTDIRDGVVWFEATPC